MIEIIISERLFLYFEVWKKLIEQHIKRSFMLNLLMCTAIRKFLKIHFFAKLLRFFLAPIVIVILLWLA